MFSISRQQFNQLKNDQQGIALVLTILVLANLLMITFAVTDVILRIGKTSQQISESEVAYFAAESAIEKSIYQIEQNKDASTLGVVGDPNIADLIYTQGNWESYTQPVYDTLPVCVDDQQKITFPYIEDPQDTRDDLFLLSGQNCIFPLNGLGQIDNANYLVIMLRAGKSFELDLDIAMPLGSNFYPHDITIEWEMPNPAGSVIVLTGTTQDKTDTSLAANVVISPVGGFGDTPDYRLRIINNESQEVFYHIKPNIGDYLPIGTLITSKGYFSDDNKKERIIQAQRRNWSIY